jgi:hypothetical protein
MIYKNYLSMAEQKMDRNMNNCELYVSSALTSTFNLTQDQELIEELSSPTGNSLTKKLDNLCNYSLKIDGATAYSLNGRIYTSSKVTNVPILEKLREDVGIHNFLESDEKSFISVRNKQIALIYNNTVYPEEYGIITCCYKVYKNQNLVGYIFADIIPANLYQYFNPSYDDYFKNTKTFISRHEEFLSYQNNLSFISYFREAGKDKISKDLKYILITNESDYLGSSFTSIIPLSKLIISLALILGLMLLVSVILIIGIHFISKYFSSNVTERLDKLLSKMSVLKKN